MQNLLQIYRKNTSVIELSVCDYQFNDGDKIYFTVKTAPDSDETDSSALIKADWTVGTDTSVDKDGNMQVTLSPEQTDIAYGDYFYDFKLISAENDAEQTLVTGNISILDVATLRA